MMKSEILKIYLENSFLKELLKRDDITDISFNGSEIFYVSNENGRNRYEINIQLNEINNFIKQIANLSEKSFSYSNPILDISVYRYRILAIHNSLGRKDFNEVFSFSIRIRSNDLRIFKGSGFLNEPLEELFQYFIDNRKSIILFGVTGSGKTEFQKYLISTIKEINRIIIIDNINELDNIVSKADINIYEYNENNKDINEEILIKSSLRSNPDWLILAEARGKEMKSILDSSLTGHPIITCLHGKDCKSILSRIESLILSSNANLDQKLIREDILSSFEVFVCLDKRVEKNKSINRYIKEIGISYKDDIYLIYKNYSKEDYFKIPSDSFISNKELSKKTYSFFNGDR